MVHEPAPLQTIPYGERSILLGTEIVMFCDRVLDRREYPTGEALMVKIAEIYQEYKEKFRGQ